MRAARGETVSNNSPIWNEADLETLRQHYRPGRQIAIQLSQTVLPHYTPRQISGKAHRLNLSHKRWSDEEEELLEVVAESMPLPDLARYWRRQAERRGWQRRSYSALQQKIHAMGYSQKPIAAGWSAKGLARVLGIAPKTVFDWIKSGKLKTKWVGEEGGERLITAKQLRDFAFSYPAEFRDLRNMDNDAWVWLLQAISDVKPIG